MTSPDGPGKAAGVFFIDEAAGPTGADAKNYANALKQAIAGLDRLDPAAQAARAGARVAGMDGDQTLIGLTFLGQPVQVDWPSGRVTDTETGQELSLWERVILLHYLGGTVEVPVGGEWIGFAQVPGAAFYSPAFMKRTNTPLAEAFGDDPQRLLIAGEGLGAEPYNLGDAGLILHVLPKVPIAVVVYGGDEEFPADAKVLYDTTISAYLNTEDIAVLGGLVVGRIIRAGQAG